MTTFGAALRRRSRHHDAALTREAQLMRLLDREAVVFDVDVRDGVRRWRISSDQPLTPLALGAIRALRSGGDRFLFLSSAERARVDADAPEPVAVAA